MRKIQIHQKFQLKLSQTVKRIINQVKMSKLRQVQGLKKLEGTINQCNLPKYLPKHKPIKKILQKIHKHLNPRQKLKSLQ